MAKPKKGTGRSNKGARAKTEKRGNKTGRAKVTARKKPGAVRRTAKKKPTEKSARKKAAKKKPAAPRRRPSREALLPVRTAPQPVSIPGAWPFPLGNPS